MKRYIVTGGAGFIGSALARRLVKSGADVFVIDDLSTGYKRNIPIGAKLCVADISKERDLRGIRLPAKIDAVFHLAAQPSGEASFDDPVRDTEVNYTGTYNVLKLTQAKKCRRFVYASSMSVYGDVPGSVERVAEDYACAPASYYGCNKLASEKMIRIFSGQAGIEPTVLRLFSVYGPGQNMLNMKQGIVSIYMSYLSRGVPVHVKGSLDRFRDIVYVEDAVDAFVVCERRRASFGGTFNVGTGKKTRVKELLKVLLRSYGKTDFDSWVICEGSTPGDVKGCVADISRIHSAVGWGPRHGLDEGVMAMKRWAEQTKRLWKL